jgi:hypothetical protein
MQRAFLRGRQRHQEAVAEWAHSLDADSIIDPESVTHKTPHRGSAIGGCSDNTAGIVWVCRVERAMFLGLADPRLCKSLAHPSCKDPSFLGGESGLLRTFESARSDQHKIVAETRYTLAADRDTLGGHAESRPRGLLGGDALHGDIVRVAAWGGKHRPPLASRLSALELSLTDPRSSRAVQRTAPDDPPTDPMSSPAHPAPSA